MNTAYATLLLIATAVYLLFYRCDIYYACVCLCSNKEFIYLSIYLQVVEDVNGLGHIDLSARAGDLVGVIQQKDPMGNRDRWFCDNGGSQVGYHSTTNGASTLSQHELSKQILHQYL